MAVAKNSGDEAPFDPEHFLFEIAGALHAATDQEALEEAWRKIVTPHAGRMSDETLSIAMRLYSLNSTVLTLKGARYE
jgi:hypothetical protein